MKWKFFVVVAIFFHVYTDDNAQSMHSADSLRIQKFQRGNNLQLFSGANRNFFSITPLHEDEKKYWLNANTSNYFGFNINYKWFSFLYSLNIPHTSLDNQARQLKASSYQLYQFGKKWGIQGNFENFHGLLIRQKHNSGFETFPAIHYFSLGFDAYYFTNSDQFSYRSAVYYSEEQKKSAGSFILKLSPFWHSFTHGPGTITAPDSLSHQFLINQPKWLSVTAGLGYAYNFIFKNGLWSICPIVFQDAGIIYEESSSKIYTITALNYCLNAGYNGRRHFYILNGLFNQSHSRFSQASLYHNNWDVSVTAGWRFGNTKRKILGIL
jgi:hypothetical protein